MKNYGIRRGDNPGQVVLTNRLGTLGTFTYPFAGYLDGTGAVTKKDEVAVYLHPEQGKNVLVRFSRTDLQDWCRQVLELL